MRKALKDFLLSLVVWEGLVGAWIMLMYVLAGQSSLGPEAKRYFDFAGILGLIVVLPCWFVCRKLRRVGSVVAGLALGLAIPAIASWVGGKAVDYWVVGWGHYRTSFDLWIEGLQLSAPSGIAGAIIGLIEGRKAMAGKPE